MESPGSPLSEHNDEEFQMEEEAYNQRYMTSGASPSPTELNARPTKRQKTGGGSHSLQHATNFDALPPPPPENEDISSDTDGSVPGSPHLNPTAAAALAGEDDDGGYGHRGEQISFCRWEGCPAGDLSNMDLLVQHLHDVHIHARQKKYSCEWADCTRKGIPHASGYALRAHMRSHTREKPFYCTLPECDRSFTRSDALAKHMRTVHETEALRPSDPVPKHHSSNPQNKHQKIRITFKAASSANGDAKSNLGSVPASPMTGPNSTTALDEEYEANNVVYVPASSSGVGNGNTGAQPELMKQFPPDIQFSAEELALPPEKLYKVLKCQVKWASEDGADLAREVAELDERRRKEWFAKELALENLMEAEAVGMHRKGPKKYAHYDIGDEIMKLQDDVPASIREMPLVTGGKEIPWWRAPRREGANDNWAEVKKRRASGRPPVASLPTAESVTAPTSTVGRMEGIE